MVGVGERRAPRRAVPEGPRAAARACSAPEPGAPSRWRSTRSGWRSRVCRRRRVDRLAARGRRGAGCAAIALTRVQHAAGKSYPDLIRMRAGQRRAGARRGRVSRERRAGRGRFCSSAETHGIAVVPFGGGTSVVGGVEPIRGSFESLIALDLGANGRRERRRRAVADGRARARACAARRSRPRSAARDLTLGHFPQSFEYATLGGWVATRSAGQASTGYGKIEEMVVGRALRDARPGRSSRGRCRRAPPARSCASCWSAPRECSA